ncbi:MAG: Clp1/GlmU family protein [Desulfurococcus sp.]|nr:Clp1/GlmU family protein [Desulfurococcus sp.]
MRWGKIPRLSLARGEFVKVYGPMHITITKGSVSILWRTFREGESLVVHKSRNYIIEALEDSELDVNMSNESTIQPLDEQDPYRMRVNLALDVVSRGFKRIVVIGGTDSGKSSFSTLLVNIAMSTGLKPGLVDGDLGQSNIGPPGFISLGVPEKPVLWSSEIPVYAMKFIGDIRPQGYTHVIPREIKWLLNLAESAGCNITVVDTDGWVKDPGAVYYKQHLVEVVEPDVIVVFGEGLSQYFKRYKLIGVEVYELPEPSARKIRSREERRLLRSMKYRDFLANAPLRRIPMDSILINGHPLFHGYPVDASMLEGLVEGKVVYASRIHGELNIYGSIKAVSREELAKKLGVSEVRVHNLGFEKGVYCSVGSLRGGDYPCLLEKLDFESKQVLVRTGFQGKIDILKLSPIRLREDYSEEYIGA